MRTYFIIILIVLLSSCSSPFEEDNVLKYESELLELIEQLNSSTPLGDEWDEDVPSKLDNLGIDEFKRNLTSKEPRFPSDIENKDSIYVFMKKDPETDYPIKKIIYDYALSPRNFGNIVVKDRMYTLVQVDERWYFATEGYE